MTSANVSGVVREALIEDTGTVRVDGVVREALVENTGTVRLDGVVREVLLLDPPDKWVLTPRWARRMPIIEEPENDPDFAALALSRWRTRVIIGPARKLLRAYFGVNS